MANTKFVGAFDELLLDITATDTEAIGAWFDIKEAEVHNILASVGTLGGETLTIVVESDLGIEGGTQKTHIIKTFVFTVNDSQQEFVVSLGGKPGGRRIRARAVITSGTATCDCEARESRSGLA